MNSEYLMLHFGELSTKGDNKKLFIRQLIRNVRHALRGFPEAEVSYDHDHGYVALKDYDPESIIKPLQEVSGLQKISLVFRSEKEIDALKKNALDLLSKEVGKTFKINSKRADKTYPLDSYGIAKALGGYILATTKGEWTVDVHNPDVTINVDIRKDNAYLSCHSYPGAGGYPLGMSGKVMMLLSGGIDSPVAASLLLRRGIRIECIHFAAPPYTSDAVIEKLGDIIQILNLKQEDIKLNIVPFTELQLAIYKNVPEPYCITLMRRMMVRIAERLAKKHNCLAIATGESVGQVASQTLESIQVINEVTNFPILRPLATTDKLEVIDTAKRIGTYEISIRPYEDCCTIFKPKAPKTKPHLADCLRFEELWDYSSMVEDCVKNVTTILYKNGERTLLKGPEEE